ncbi:putative quinone oxidoreductase [Dorcoceras hygrometricum]|uniref:Putative quinone oxidoreductase n=1 Tax=Dorcoceras hygrometricum TaxID=472368 RepID=A0A2Z7C870_9LAMI|nr:putative quinone oxidoreductase [Dorcoceras hygrometricum]
MRAAFVRKLGGPEAIEIGQLPVPACGPRDVLARVEALGVNHVDTFVRSGAYATPVPMPFIVGRDFVGRVVATGEAVRGFAPGDRVWCNSLGHAGRQGAFAEYALAPAERVYPLPDGVDPAEAVSLLHAAATAWLGLFREGALKPGETVYVGGAGGGVGSAAVQLAVATGARVLGAASGADAGWVRGLGVAAVFDYRDPALYEHIGAAAADGVDLYWDTSGHHDFERTLPLLRRGGRVILAAGLKGSAPPLPVGALYTRDASLRGFAISNAPVQDLAEAARSINRHLAAGDLKTRIGLRLPLEDTARAHRLLEDPGGGHVGGRIVVIP